MRANGVKCEPKRAPRVQEEMEIGSRSVGYMRRGLRISRRVSRASDRVQTRTCMHACMHTFLRPIS
eukprot:6176043-Pleurochrysis_carterae.AAC.5